MRDYIEERVLEIAAYIIEHNATVRDAAKVFQVSKSTVHMVHSFGNGPADNVWARRIASE